MPATDPFQARTAVAKRGKPRPVMLRTSPGCPLLGLELSVGGALAIIVAGAATPIPKVSPAAAITTVRLRRDKVRRRRPSRPPPDHCREFLLPSISGLLVRCQKSGGAVHHPCSGRRTTP